MKKLLIIAGLVVVLFAIGINHPRYANTYSGETVTGAALAGIASCAAMEAWNSTKQKDARTVTTQPERSGSSRMDCINACDRRFPEPSMVTDFEHCVRACQ